MLIRSLAKKAYIDMLFQFRHTCIYEFHHVTADGKTSSAVLDEELFYRFIDEHGPYTTLENVLKKGEGKAITFDDGLLDTYTIAFPYLKKKGIPFTMFVLTGLLGTPGYMTKENMLEMSENELVTIGSHGINHLKFGDLTGEEQAKEIIKSKRYLEDAVGYCDYIAYPFGSYNEITKKLVEDTGYKNAFAVKGRPVNKKIINEMKYEIPRLSIKNETLIYYNR